MTVVRSTFPQRSPMPFMVPWTWVAPAVTAARALATARPESLWGWMPMVDFAPTWALASWTNSAMRAGREPPLVSQRQMSDAPACEAASMVLRPYSRLAAVPSKKCSAS